MKYQNTKSAKGITLVALIITIIVLLILAVVAIRAVNSGGIIEHAQSASSAHKIAQEKEEINLAILEWQVTPANGRQSLVDFLDARFVSATETDGIITVTMESGNQYTVENYQVSDEPIEKNINVSVNNSTLAPTQTATITVSGVGGVQVEQDKVTYSSDNTAVATVSNNGTVTAVAEGTANITVTYGDYSKIVTITVSDIQSDNLERIYYVEDGAWEDEYVTSEAEVPDTATITAKFYKTSIPFQPSVPEHWNSKDFKEGYAYKVIIDGTGDMPAIVDMNNESCAAWGFEILAAQEGDEENIIWYIKDVEISGVTSVGVGAFIYSCCIQTCSLGNDVTKIEKDAFNECGALQSINLGNVTEIGEAAFYATRSLKTVDLSQNSLKIKANAFEYSGLESIELNNVTEIGEEAFYECEASIKINKTADEIKAMANYFWGASGKIYDKDNNLVQ